MRVRYGVTLWAGILLATAAAAAKTTIPAEPIRTALDGAERVVRARAVSDTCFVVRRATKRAPRELRTDWKLDVLESWKGPMERGVPLTLRIKGGRLGGVADLVEGEPEIIRGGEYLFFLRFDPQTRRWVTSSAGWGCLPIVRSMISRPIGDGSVKVTIMRLRREVQTILERGGDGSDGSGADTTVIGR